MIDRIITRLAEEGVLPSADPERYLWACNNRANINVLLFERAGGELRVFAKLSDKQDFGQVFERMRQVYRAGLEILPEPLSCFVVEDFSVLVTRAHRLRLLSDRRKLSRAQQSTLLETVTRAITQLHAATRDGTLVLDYAYFRELAEDTAPRFFRQWADHALEQKFRRHLAGLVERGAITSPRIPQHGDLVTFNTGLVEGRVEYPMIIDWDGYGESDLPSLDVTTFLLSFAGAYGLEFYGGGDYRGEFAGLIDSYCRGTGQDPHYVRELIPLCLLYSVRRKLEVGEQAWQRQAYREMQAFFATVEG